MEDEPQLLKPAAKIENAFVRFLGFRYSDARKQEVEYHFLVKNIPDFRYFFFEHVSGRDGSFHPYDWKTFATSTDSWAKNENWKVKTRHHLPIGDYQFFIGFASANERMEFSNTVDNRIPIGTLTFDPDTNPIKESMDESVQPRSEEYKELLRIKEQFEPFRGMSFPLYISESLEPLAWPKTNKLIKNKAIIISIPKAGTYLAAELLTNIGIVSAGLHVSLIHLEDYRFYTYNDLANRDEVFRTIPLYMTSAIIQSGQFIVGHIPYSIEAENMLLNYRRIFVYRNLRDTIVTTYRGDTTDKRGTPEMRSILAIENQSKRMSKYLEIFGESLFKDIKDIAQWSKRDVFKLQFETLMGDFGKEKQHECMKDLCTYLGTETSPDDIANVLSRTIGKRTLTYSGNRSKVEDYWNEEVERWFRKLGGVELNKLLGYDREASPNP